MKKLLLTPLLFIAFLMGCSQQANTNTPTDSSGRIVYQLGMTLSEAQTLAKVTEAQAIGAARSATNSQALIKVSRLAGIDGFLGWDVQLENSRAFVDAANSNLVSLNASTIFGLEDDSGTASEAETNEIEEDELQGVISNLDDLAKTFSLAVGTATYTVDYAQATLKGTLADGVNVEAEGALTGTNLVATEVEVEEPKFEGTLSNLDEAAKTFSLTTSTQTLSVDYGLAMVEGTLLDGVLVEVEGSLSGTTVTASKVEIEDENETETDDANETEDLMSPTDTATQ